MLDNIRAHSLVVTRVAQVLLTALANSTKTNCPLPAKNLVLAGALLHDIAKTPCLENSCDHARQGRDICLELGYPEVAEVVREHVILTKFSPKRYNEGYFLAKELVYYADKRVRHDEIVSLEERLDYILERYGNNDPIRHCLIKENFDKCKQLETFLFFSADMKTEALPEAVAGNNFTTQSSL
ncbi:MAG: HD domain-containing protein [Desulfocapsa sp.]|nr:HD domain-containing protein [Desulfocapsa sp.]